MGNYYFVYAVDVLDRSGHIESNIMLLDHEEVQEIVSDAINSGKTVVEIHVSMFDNNGSCINERDITRLLASN